MAKKAAARRTPTKFPPALVKAHKMYVDAINSNDTDRVMSDAGRDSQLPAPADVSGLVNAGGLQDANAESTRSLQQQRIKLPAIDEKAAPVRIAPFHFVVDPRRPHDVNARKPGGLDRTARADHLEQRQHARAEGLAEPLARKREALHQRDLVAELGHSCGKHAPRRARSDDRDAGHSQDSGFRIQDSGCRSLNSEFCILNSAFCILHSAF